MKIGLLVEGPIDKIVFEELQRKLNVSLKVRVIDNKDKIFNTKKVVPHIESLLLDEKCSKVIILVDRDDDTIDELTKRFDNIRTVIDKTQLNNVFFNIVNKKIESWLLTAIYGCSKNPELEENPEERLSQCLKRRFKKGLRTAKMLAKKLSINDLKEKCPSFQQFLNSLTDP